MMMQKVHEVMTRQPTTVSPGTSLAEAARLMREHEIGDVLVADEGKLQGIVTDRDIVVRAVADASDPRSIMVGDVCSRDPICVGPQEAIDQAVQLMRTQAVRRIPVVDGDRLVGVVSLGDMAVERDAQSVLAQISTADSNN